jgi:DNA ligase-1
LRELLKTEGEKLAAAYDAGMKVEDSSKGAREGAWKKSENEGDLEHGKETGLHGTGDVIIEKTKKKGNVKIQYEKALSRKKTEPRLANRNLIDVMQSSSKDTISNNRIQLITQIMSSDEKEIQAFMDSAIAAGCEGIMLKHRDSVYRAGSREYLWIKVKREYRSELADTLDLVIIGALYGRGRRVGKYGALLLAVYDEDRDLFRSVSKVGTGFTDQHLENFYNSLESLRIGHKSPRVDTRMDQMDVWFEPKIVIEVIASEITLSPSHTAGLNSIREGYGLALRFPKFTGKIRDDKGPEDATSIYELIEIFKQQLKKRTK